MSSYTWYEAYTGSVTVEVSDGKTTSTDEATVRVYAAEEQLQTLAGLIVDLLGEQGLGNALTTKLYHAIDQLPTHPHTAFNQLNAFIHHVEAQAGKKVLEDYAADWIAKAETAIESIEATYVDATDAVMAELTSLLDEDPLALTDLLQKGKANGKR